MKLFPSLLIGGLLLATTISAHAEGNSGGAGFYLEPGLTYEMGNNTYTWPGPWSSSTGTTKGLGLDLKAGMDFAEIFFAGLDASYSQPTFTNSANNYNATATESTIGAIVGAQMPVVGLRIWGGYIFDGTLDPSADGNFDVKFTGANGYKIGAGFHILMVSLNIEYSDLTFNNATLQQAGPFTNVGLGSSKFENKTTLVSVSLPITL